MAARLRPNVPTRLNALFPKGANGFALACALALSACSQAPVRTVPGAGPAGPLFGQWRGKALVQDPRDGKARTLSLDLLAQEPDRLRIDITGSMGAYVGTFVAANGRFSFISAFEKKFVSGPTNSKRARDLLRLPLQASDIVSLLLERPLGKAWACSTAIETAGGLRCHSEGDRAPERATVEVERDGDARRFAFRASPSAAPALLRVTAASTNGQPDPKAFVLAKPRGFEEQILSQ